MASVAALAGTTTYDYDSIGRLRKVSHADGKITDYTLDAAGNRTAVATIVDTTPPSVPTGLAGAPTALPSVVLTWNPSTDPSPGQGISGYRIFRNGGQVAQTSGTTTTFTDTAANGLASGTTYTYAVAAIDKASNVSAASSPPISVTTPAFVDTWPPSSPGSFTASALSATSVRITWAASTDNVGVTSYVIDRCTGVNCNSGYTPVATWTSGPLQVDDNGRTPSTTYGYRIVARDAATNTSPASTTSVTTPSDTTKPSVPGSPTASPTGETSVRLTWTASNDNVGVVGYMIERCSSFGCTNFTPVNSTPVATLFFDNTGLAGATTYRYQIRARDAAGNNSDPSAIVTATTYPGIPTNLSVPTSINTTGNYGVSWWAANGGLEGVTFELQESKDDPNFGNPVLYSTAGTAQPITGRANGSYWYRVRECNATGCSSYLTATSAVVVAVPDTSRPSTPGNPSAVGLDSTNVRITWTASTDNIGVTAYDVHRCTTIQCTTSTNIGPVPGNVLTINDAVLAGITVYYRIYARDAAGNVSDPTAVVSATTWPPVPISIIVPTGTSTTGAYDVSWNISSGSGITYELQESKNDPNFGGSPIVYSTAGTVRNITGKTDGSYYYRVRACNVMGCSGYLTASNPATVLIPPATQIFIDPVSVSGQTASLGQHIGFTYGLASNGNVSLSGTGPVSFSGPARINWLFPVSGMNLYQARAGSGCPNRTGTFGTWQALGTGTTPTWGVLLTQANRFAQCTITIEVSAIANPGVILGSGTISVDLSTEI